MGRHCDLAGGECWYGYSFWFSLRLLEGPPHADRSEPNGSK
jgi:hypothetical protein